jgi:hypothetical protein
MDHFCTAHFKEDKIIMKIISKMSCYVKLINEKIASYEKYLRNSIYKIKNELGSFIVYLAIIDHID